MGVILSNELREEGYLEPAMQKFKMSSSTKTGLEFRLAQPAQDNYLSGTVVDGSGNELAGAYVYAWTYDGRESSVYADNNGDFNMTVPSGALWKLGAEYSEFDANDDEILYLPENDEEADLRNNEFVSGISIVLTRPEFEVPDGISITFDPSKDFVTTLPDGTEITIPGGALMFHLMSKPLDWWSLQQLKVWIRAERINRPTMLILWSCSMIKEKKSKETLRKMSSFVSLWMWIHSARRESIWIPLRGCIIPQPRRHGPKQRRVLSTRKR